jgi:hypothetical protein
MNMDMNALIYDFIPTLIAMDEVKKVKLYHYYNTGCELSDEEILMTFTNTQILDISDDFDTRLLDEFPVFARTIAELIDFPGQERFNGPYAFTDNGNQDLDELQELGQIWEEFEFLEAEHNFVTSNTTELVDDMPDCKKFKNN